MASTTGDIGSRVRLGTAPDSWGVWFPSDPKQVPWERFLHELAEAGYEWFELGPHGYLPTDPSQLSDEVNRRGLKVSGGGVFGALHRADTWERDLGEARKVASLVKAMGAEYLIYLPEAYRDLEGRFTDKRELDDEDWARLASQMSEIGRIMSSDYGVRLVFHPHADSHVGTQAEVERFLEMTDPDSVSLCLDTGHICYCGGDNLELIENFPERIGYVHLKAVDLEVLDQVRADDLCFAEAVRRGAMCEPPLGIPSMEPIITALGKLDVDIFAIVEQDLYPCDPNTPLPIARRTRKFFSSCGI